MKQGKWMFVAGWQHKDTPVYWKSLQKEIWYTTSPLFPLLQEWSAASANSCYPQQKLPAPTSSVSLSFSIHSPEPQPMLRRVTTLTAGKEIGSYLFDFFLFNILYCPLFVHAGAGEREWGALPWFMHRIALSLSSVCKENIMGKGPKVDSSGSEVISGLQTLTGDFSLIPPRNVFLRRSLSDTVKAWGRGWSLGFYTERQSSLPCLQVVHTELQCEQGQATMFSWALTRQGCQGI